MYFINSDETLWHIVLIVTILYEVDELWVDQKEGPREENCWEQPTRLICFLWKSFIEFFDKSCTFASESKAIDAQWK